MLSRLKALASRQDSPPTIAAAPEPLRPFHRDVPLRSCMARPHLKTWRSGFLRHEDYLRFTPRRANTLFAVHEPDDGTAPPVHERLPQAYFGGVLYPFYGHFLIETLSRLPHIPDDGVPIVYMCLENTIKDWQRGFFADTGLDRRVRFTRNDQLLEVGQLFQVDQTTTVHADISSRFIAYTQGLFPTSPSQGRRLYLSRRLSKNAPVLREDAFETGLQDLGLEVISPETLTIREQVRLLDEADVVVAVEGSALHTLIFSSTPKQVLVLPRRKELDLNFVLQFAMQGQIRLQQIHAMACQAENFSAPSELDVDRALTAVRAALSPP